MALQMVLDRPLDPVGILPWHQAHRDLRMGFAWDHGLAARPRVAAPQAI
jgi:hypothetical protein